MNSLTEHRSTKNTSRKHKVLRVAGAAGIILGSYGAAAHVDTFKPATEETRHESDHAASPQEIAKNTAETAAKSYSEALNKGEAVGGIRVMNGTIDVMSHSGRLIPGYKNPILLSTTETLNTADFDVESLEDGWVGIQSTDEKGNVLIIPMPLDGKLARFVPYDEKQLLLADSVGVYATDVELSEGFHEKQLIAYDMEGETQIQNPDHTPVQPGLSITWG